VTTSDIPVPPYDQPLPREYWQNLRLPKTIVNFSCRDARVRARGHWLKAAGLLALALGALGLITAKTLNQEEFPAPALHRADLVSNPWVAPRAIPTGRYWLNLPDGRHILVNYRGEVADYAHLPAQPPGGANNAAYYDQGTGNTWIWTVPAGASNVAQWIDP
jgi:hypothetical protein